MGVGQQKLCGLPKSPDQLFIFNAIDLIRTVNPFFVPGAAAVKDLCQGRKV